MSTPLSPLHDELPSEIKGLQMQHWYSRCDVPWREASVVFKNNKITVKSMLNGEPMIETFCKRDCIEIVEPLTKPELTINIRHSCVEGWRMIFQAGDRKVLIALKDAITRVKHNQLLSHNLLLDDRCKLLDLPSRGLSQDQVRRMREETTVAVPKGTATNFGTRKYLQPGGSLTLRVVNACPAMRIASSTQHYPLSLSVENGVVCCVFPRGITLTIESADFFPPRLVSPPSDKEQIFVCDSRDQWNSRQAWVFETDKAHVSQLLETIMHAWMEVGGTTRADHSSKSKEYGGQKTDKAEGVAKKRGPARKAAPKTSATRSESKAAPKAKTPKKAKRVPKGPKKPVPKKNASGRVAKKVVAVRSTSSMRTRSTAMRK